MSQWDNSISSDFGPALPALYGAIGNCTILTKTCVLHNSMCVYRPSERPGWQICWCLQHPNNAFLWSRRKSKRVIQLWGCSCRIRSPLLCLLSALKPKSDNVLLCSHLCDTEALSCLQQNTSAETIPSFQYVRCESLLHLQLFLKVFLVIWF